jgi:catechol 2,3-dioxygenase-like lactoylglutathione lyase family enzyme
MSDRANGEHRQQCYYLEECANEVKALHLAKQPESCCAFDGGVAVTIVLNHTIVPARDKVAAARFFADIFGLPFDQESGHFAPVRVNDSLTFLFNDDASFESHHYAFHVTDAEFDSICERIKQIGLAYGSAPSSLEDGRFNDWNGGRGVYFKDLNGHILELMTMPQ